MSGTEFIANGAEFGSKLVIPNTRAEHPEALSHVINTPLKIPRWTVDDEEKWNSGPRSILQCWGDKAELEQQARLDWTGL